MKRITLVIATLLLGVTALASVKFFNSSNLDLGHFSEAKCGTNVTCTKSSGKVLIEVSGMSGDVIGDGGDQLFGFLQNEVAASATTITAAQCGSTFSNASAAIEMELPEASTVIGCRLTFIVGSANALTIDPDAADQILLLTNAAGDSLAADAAGESVVIEAISATAWAPVGAEKGTWTDSN